jgi:hypothetical protein
MVTGGLRTGYSVPSLSLGKYAYFAAIWPALTGHTVCRWLDVRGYLHKLDSLLKGSDTQERNLYVSGSPHLAALAAIIVRNDEPPNGTKSRPKKRLALIVIIQL